MGGTFRRRSTGQQTLSRSPSSVHGRIALDRCGRRGTVTAERMAYLPDDDGGLTCAGSISVAGGLDQRKDIFVDAATGAVVKEYNRVVMDGPVTGSGVDVKGVTRSLNLYQIGAQYYMIDASKPMYIAGAVAVAE